MNANAYLKQACPAASMLLTIHDELCFEIPTEALTATLVEGIEKSMSGNFHTLLGMPSPFKVESSVVYENWSKKEKWEPNKGQLELKDWVHAMA